jgi:hypothetical protein
MNNLGGINWGDCTPQARTIRLYQRYTEAIPASSTVSYQFKDLDEV